MKQFWPTRARWWALLPAVLLCIFPLGSRAQYAPGYKPWPRQLYSTNLAVVVNDDDPRSVELGEYYRQARSVPEKNLIHVRIPGSPSKLTAPEFAALKQEIETQLEPAIQAMVLVWTAPYAVECNSITAALTLGFDAKVCENSCGRGKLSPVYDSPSARPYSDRGLRLSMLLPTESIEQGRALIDRGLASDESLPAGSAYFLKTSDTARSTRSVFFPKSGIVLRPPLKLVNLNADSIQGKKDVMFYFTGAMRVPKLETLKFLPGAVADHLTSTGGDLLGGAQMSSLRWLEAGATASYGTVSEPCNYPQKFPNPGVLLKHYLAGETIIEAYWKSVAWPAQGLFIGEPLAAPYRR
jgi:uncharacterized protein (TIGR03790 family)